MDLFGGLLLCLFFDQYRNFRVGLDGLNDFVIRRFLIEMLLTRDGETNLLNERLHQWELANDVWGFLLSVSTRSRRLLLMV